MKIWKILLIGGLLCVLAYVGVCSYATIIRPGQIRSSIPEVTDARYLLTIQNTGRQVLTNSYDYDGQTYTIHGFYVYERGRFVYRQGDIILDKRSFGEITVTRRQ